MSADAGVVLQDLNNFAASHGRIVPIDLASRGSCHIGGNIATCAGGVNFIRYGSLHANVLGLEVVLADGTIMNDMSRVLKDNTGYHMSHLFIGSEGTLGIITGVSILTHPKPQSQRVVLFAISDYSMAPVILKMAHEHLGSLLNAFEYFDTDAAQLVEVMHGYKRPFANVEGHVGYLLVELAGFNPDSDEVSMQMFVDRVMGERHPGHDGVLQACAEDAIWAHSDTPASDLWRLRESISDSVSCRGYPFKYDVSIPIAEFSTMVQATRERMPEGVITCGYGHVGDGNLHLNCTDAASQKREESSPERLQLIKDALEPFVYDKVQELGGSISAEHGIGQMKPKVLATYKDADTLLAMRKMKQALDPNGIMNPGKVIQR